MWLIQSGFTRVSRCLGPAVTMVKNTPVGCGHDLGLKARRPFNGSFARSVLVQANVSSVLVIVSKVVAPKMGEDDTRSAG
jgi:hypothetical protein